jgi:hypothetical protein
VKRATVRLTASNSQARFCEAESAPAPRGCSVVSIPYLTSLVLERMQSNDLLEREAECH